MGNNKTPKCTLLREYVKLYGKIENINVFEIDGEVFHCNVCNIDIKVEKKFQVDQHARSACHTRKVETSKISPQKFIKNAFEVLKPTNSQLEFEYDLCEALVSSNIPMYKLDNEISTFLNKYLKRKISAYLRFFRFISSFFRV